MSAIHYVDPGRWRAVVALAAAAGTAVGTLDPVLRQTAGLLGLAPHAGTWAAVFLLVPWSAGLARWYPRRPVVVGATLLAAGAYALSVTVAYGVLLRSWALPAVARDASSVMLVAAPIYLLVAHLTLLTVRSRRTVGFDPRTRCQGCGYLLTGLTEPRCPECGRAFDARLLRPARIDASASRG